MTIYGHGRGTFGTEIPKLRRFKLKSQKWLCQQKNRNFPLIREGFRPANLRARFWDNSRPEKSTQRATYLAGSWYQEPFGACSWSNHFPVKSDPKEQSWKISIISWILMFNWYIVIHNSFVVVFGAKRFD